MVFLNRQYNGTNTTVRLGTFENNTTKQPGSISLTRLNRIIGIALGKTTLWMKKKKTIILYRHNIF